MTAPAIAPSPSRLAQGSDRAIWAAVAVACMTVGVALVRPTSAQPWQLALSAMLPDAPLALGIARGLDRGQLHPRAVRPYNATHRLLLPIILAVVGVAISPAVVTAATGWLFHICFDHAIGLGLRGPDGRLRPHATTRTARPMAGSHTPDPDNHGRDVSPARPSRLSTVHRGSARPVEERW
jgi:hypothetical protein